MRMRRLLYWFPLSLTIKINERFLSPIIGIGYLVLGTRSAAKFEKFPSTTKYTITTFIGLVFGWSKNLSFYCSKKKEAKIWDHRKSRCDPVLQENERTTRTFLLCQKDLLPRFVFLQQNFRQNLQPLTLKLTHHEINSLSSQSEWSTSCPQVRTSNFRIWA